MMAIQVNDVTISDEAVFQEMQYHPSDDRLEATDKAAKALLVKEILRQEAVKQLFVTEDADDQELEQGVMMLIEENVISPEANDEMCARYYEQNKERFKILEDGLILPFNMVQDRVRNYLHTRSVREGLRSYILSLAEKAQVKGVDINYL